MSADVENGVWLAVLPDRGAFQVTFDPADEGSAPLTLTALPTIGHERRSIVRACACAAIAEVEHPSRTVERQRRPVNRSSSTWGTSTSLRRRRKRSLANMRVRRSSGIVRKNDAGSIWDECASSAAHF